MERMLSQSLGHLRQHDDRENRVVGKQGRMAKALVYGRYIELAEEPVWQGV